MVKRRLLVVSLVLSLLPTPFKTFGATEGTQISRKQIANYLKDPLEQYAGGDSPAWEDRMYRLLDASRDADATARALAQEDHTSIETEKTLIWLWMEYSETRNLRGGRDLDKFKAQIRALQETAIKTVRMTGHEPLAMRIAAQVLTEYSGCSLELFDELLKGAADALLAGTKAAEEAGCTSWWLSLHSRFPQDAGILWELTSQDEDLSLAERLAIFDTLSAQKETNQETRVNIRRDHISTLWDAGLIAEGLALVDSTETSDRELLLKVPEPRLLVGRSNFRLNYVAALYVSNRAEEAARSFQSLEHLLDVETGFQWQMKWLNSALHRSTGDPYLLLEGGVLIDSGSALWAEAVRKHATGDNYASLRQDLATSWVRRYQDRKAAEMAPLITRFMEPEFRPAVARYESKIQSALTPWAVSLNPAEGSSRRRHATPPALAAGFRELPMPENLRTKRTGKEKPPKWPTGVAALPQGFFPVRLERGALTVAVSLSQNLDPVGEVSEGGYWIHLSRDAGATWSEPLYTGLLDLFPYVLAPTSKMPLVSGDRITMEVVIQELDPSSITYPPVALRSRRTASDLYLEMPLTALQSDRDHDGLTDIVEAHLLLNPDSADSDGDGVRDGKDPLPNVKNANANPENAYMAKIFQTIFGIPADPIIEPVDRDAGELIQFKFGEPPSLMRPFFVEGRPEDFAGVRLPSPLLVYAASDVERLNAHSPDFHPFNLGAIIFNRAHDRGYLSWDQGWTGGTLRLIREGDTWRVEVMSSWIT